MSEREKDRFTAAVPPEIKTRLDEEAEARGTHRSGAVVQVVKEWDERGEEIERLEREVEELRAELAEERAAEDDASWAEQVLGLSSAAALTLGVSSAVSWVSSVVLAVAPVEPLAFALALVAASSAVVALVARAAMRRTAAPDPDEEVDPDEVAG